MVLCPWYPRPPKKHLANKTLRDPFENQRQAEVCRHQLHEPSADLVGRCSTGHTRPTGPPSGELTPASKRPCIMKAPAVNIPAYQKPCQPCTENQKRAGLAQTNRPSRKYPARRPQANDHASTNPVVNKPTNSITEACLPCIQHHKPAGPAPTNGPGHKYSARHPQASDHALKKPAVNRLMY